MEGQGDVKVQVIYGEQEVYNFGWSIGQTFELYEWEID